jgi:hypothetical protein
VQILLKHKWHWKDLKGGERGVMLNIGWKGFKWTRNGAARIWNGVTPVNMGSCDGLEEIKFSGIFLLGWEEVYKVKRLNQSKQACLMEMKDSRSMWQQRNGA